MANIISAQTSELEGAGTGTWQAWFGCTIEKSTAQAFNGTGSLQINISDVFWAVQSSNWPGLAGVIGGHEYACQWAFYAPAGVTGTAEFRISWRNESGTEQLRTDIPVAFTGDGGWKQSSLVLATAPATATRAFLIINRTAGFAASQVVHADSFVIDDTPPGEPPGELPTPGFFAFI